MGDVPKVKLLVKSEMFSSHEIGWKKSLVFPDAGRNKNVKPLSKILPTHLFCDPPLHCAWIISFMLTCLIY